MPRKGTIRPCFVPRPGWVYVSCDYAALELATLAQCCLNLGLPSAMANAINEGQDLHSRLAGRFVGISYEDAMARKASKDPEFQGLRQSAKPANFGLPGLMGPPRLVLTARKDGVYFCEGAGSTPKGQCSTNVKAYRYKGRAIPPTCSVCLELATEYRELWYSEWPEMRDYHRITVEAAEECERGEAFESFGTGMLRMETSPNAVANHLFQNLAAQGAKHAAWLLAKECYLPGSVMYNNSRLVVFVHDETICEVREEVLTECAFRQAELMVQGMREYVPDVLIQVEPAAMRRWFKGAEKVLGGDGRLRPWWPKEWTWGADQGQMALDTEGAS